MFKGVILIIALLLSSTFEASFIQSKFWLTSCRLNGCNLTFPGCLGCNGVNGCKLCITSINSDCSKCADDIFDESILETIGDSKYLLCDASDTFQVNVCHIHCRGKFYKSGECIRQNNYPICKCLNEPLASNSSTTVATFTEETSQIFETTGIGFSSTKTSQPITPSIVYPTFNNNFKLNFTIGNNYQKLFALPNGELLRGSYGNEIEVWNSEGTIIRKIKSMHSYPYLFGLLSNGDLVVGYLANNTFLIWNITKTHSEYVKRTIATNDLIISLSVLDNDDLAIGQKSNNYDILIRDSQSGIVKKRLIGHRNAVYDIIKLPNRKIASCSADGTVKIWDELSTNLLNSFVHLSPVYSMALLYNNELITGLSDGSVEVWNLETGDQVRNFYIHTSAFCRNKCIHVLGNGQVISGSHNHELNIWNPQDGSLRQSLRTHLSPIYQLEVLNSGTFVTSSATEIAFWF